MPVYFAYGANMDVPAMALRCPASKPLGPGRLANHRFHIMPDGVASVARAPGSTVHGLLWDLALSDIAALDAFEEIGAGKYTKVVQPVLRAVGSSSALIYVGWSAQDGLARPGYLETVIAAGEAAGLPRAYIASLVALRRSGTKGSPFDNGPAPAGPAPGVRPRFASPLERGSR